MKSILTFLFILLAVDFAFVKVANSAERFFYCIDAEARTTRVSSAGSVEIVNSCKDVNQDAKEVCLEKAKNNYCKNLKSSAPLYGKLSEVPNTMTCYEFANKILKNRGLGSLEKPGSSVKTTIPVTKSKSGQPNFQFNITNATKGPDFANANSVYAQSKMETKSDKEIWVLGVSGNDRVPYFEQLKELGTNLGDVEPGDYRRFYNFRVVNNVCVLESVKTEFLPKAPKGQESFPKYQLQEMVLDQKRCDYSAQAFRGEKYKNQFGRTSSGDLLDNWVCSESVTAFNPPGSPAITQGSRQERGEHHTQSGR